jgi:hypothetical protein
MNNLENYTHVKTALFFRMDIAEYRTSPSVGYATEILRFSNHDTPITFASNTFTPLGRLVQVSSPQSAVRTTSNQLTVTISGVPTTSLKEIVYSKIKGSPVTVWRGFFDASNNLIDTGSLSNPAQRFVGFVNNYAIADEWDEIERTNFTTITLECNSSVDVLANKTSGRKTNPTSNNSFYPSDRSMDRTLVLSKQKFNFGAQT